MYYVHFKAKDPFDLIYEANLLPHPFLRQLGINGLFLFKYYCEDVKEAIRCLNEYISQFPDLAKETFLIGEYSVHKVPDLSQLAEHISDKILCRNELLKISIFIHQEYSKALVAKNAVTDMTINAMRATLDQMEKDNDKDDD